MARDRFPKARDMNPKRKLPFPNSKAYGAYQPPKEAIGKLQKLAKEIGERNAVRRTLNAHNARERLAAELDMLHGQGAPIHGGLIESRIHLLRKAVNFDKDRNGGSAFHPL